MSIEKLKNKIKSYAIKNNLTVQEAWDKYFFDSLLIKLSLSNYKDNFVLKGGFLLENIIGIQNRTTLDIDFSYRLNDISEEVLSKKNKRSFKNQNNKQNKDRKLIKKGSCVLYEPHLFSGNYFKI